MAIKISGTTVIDDSRNLTNVTGLKTVGGQSLLGSGDIAAGVLEAPDLSSPYDGAEFTGDIGLTYNKADASYSGAQDYVEWELYSDSSLSTLHDSFSGSSNLTSWNPSDGVATTQFWVRARTGSDGHLSPWSDTLTYTTPNVYINAPSITSPSDGYNTVGPGLTVTSSAFSSTPSGQDTHLHSDWEMASDTSFSNIVFSSYNDTSNKLSILMTGQQVSSTYYIRVRHSGTSYGDGAWSSYITVSTISDFTGSQIYTSGSGNHTTPVGIIEVEAAAVGGGGGGGSRAPYGYGGGGGGGGGCGVSRLSVNETTFSYSVGTGGNTAPTNTSSRGTSGNSSTYGPATTGGGGQGGINQNYGVGGTGTGTYASYNGGRGGAGITNDGGAAGGGAASPQGNGGNGANQGTTGPHGYAGGFSPGGGNGYPNHTDGAGGGGALLGTQGGEDGWGSPQRAPGDSNRMGGLFGGGCGGGNYPSSSFHGGPGGVYIRWGY